MRTQPVATALSNTNSSEIEHVSYDLWELRITIRLADERPAYVIFADSVGHRVLDEGDLLEFWTPESRSPGWLWEILEGGWLDACRREERLHLYTQAALKEYLVLGSNECVSVISQSPPSVYAAGARDFTA